MHNSVVAKLDLKNARLNLAGRSLNLTGIFQSGWLLLATVMAGGLNYLSNMVVGRLLLPADYGIYAALLTLFNIFAAVSGVAQVVITNYAARLEATNDLLGLRGLVAIALRPLTLTSALITIIMILGSTLLSRMLHISSAWPVVMLAVGLMPLALAPVGLGMLRGRQQFSAFGLAQIAGAVMRLVAGIGLIVFGGGTIGSVASLAFTPLAVIGVAVASLPSIWQKWQERTRPGLEALKSVLIYTVLGTLGYALLTGMDVLIVKNRFSPTEAGLYASVSIVGKIALWIPAALTTILLPKVAARRANGQSAASLLRVAQLASLGLCGSVTLLFIEEPLVMRFLFGARYETLAYLLGPYGIAMTFYALVGIWFNYFLGMKQTAYAWFLTIGAVLQVIALYVFSTSITDIVIVMISCSLTLVLAGEVLFQFFNRGPRAGKMAQIPSRTNPPGF